MAPPLSPARTHRAARWLAVVGYALLLAVFWLPMMQVPNDEAAREAVVGSVRAGSPAEAAGVRPGDTVREVDGVPVPTWEVLTVRVGASDGRPIELRIDRGGRTERLTVTPALDPQSGRYKIGLGVRTTPHDEVLSPFALVRLLSRIPQQRAMLVMVTAVYVTALAGLLTSLLWRRPAALVVPALYSALVLGWTALNVAAFVRAWSGANDAGIASRPVRVVPTSAVLHGLALVLLLVAAGVQIAQRPREPSRVR